MENYSFVQIIFVTTFKKKIELIRVSEDISQAEFVKVKYLEKFVCLPLDSFYLYTPEYRYYMAIGRIKKYYNNTEIIDQITSLTYYIIFYLKNVTVVAAVNNK